MRCNLLGSLEIMTSGGTTAVAAPKLRTVTAVLAVNAGRPVSAPYLISELWEDDPPPSASTTLQTYIYHLRKLLPTGHASVVTTEPAGYRMGLEPADVDIFGFERSLADGRRALRDEQVDSARETLRSAEGLWRGDPFADVPTGPALDAETVRLHELHMHVVELRIEAELRAGEHRALVPELRGLTGRHPLHEDFRTKLMLALFRSGRVSEALDVYSQFRGMLVDELGLEPSPAVREVHAQLLAGTDPGPPAKRTAAGAGVGPVPTVQTPVPSQLPADPRLVGRVEPLTRAESALPGVLSVVGEPGVGTTALALRVAHAVADRFPDGALHAELRGKEVVPRGPGDVLVDLLDGAGRAPESPTPSTSRLAQRFRDWCADKKMVMVLDDARDAEQVIPLLPGAGGHAIIVTSSAPLIGLPSDHTLVLSPLDRGDASAILTTAHPPDPDPTGEKPLETVLDACGGLPAALRAAAERRHHLSDVGLARRLASPEDGLDALHGPNGGSGGHARLRECISALDDTAAITLYLLSARVRGPFDVARVAQELGGDHAAAELVVDVLLDAHLLHTEGRNTRSGALRLNPLIAHHTLELYASAPVMTG